MKENCIIRRVYLIRTPVKTSGRIRYTWEDKAGGYGIQTDFGKKAVKSIDGDYYNVMGLPLDRVREKLREFGIDV